MISNDELSQASVATKSPHKSSIECTRKFSMNSTNNTSHCKLASHPRPSFRIEARKYKRVMYSLFLRRGWINWLRLGGGKFNDYNLTRVISKGKYVVIYSRTWWISVLWWKPKKILCASCDPCIPNKYGMGWPFQIMIGIQCTGVESLDAVVRIEIPAILWKW